MHACNNVCMQAHTNACVYEKHTCIDTNVRTYIHTYIHAYIHTYINTSHYITLHHLMSDLHCICIAFALHCIAFAFHCMCIALHLHCIASHYIMVQNITLHAYMHTYMHTYIHVYTRKSGGGGGDHSPAIQKVGGVLTFRVWVGGYGVCTISHIPPGQFRVYPAGCELSRGGDHSLFQ